MRSRPIPAVQLTLISLLGTLISASGFVFMAFQRRPTSTAQLNPHLRSVNLGLTHSGGHSFALVMIGAFTLIIVGFAFSIYIESRLRNGIANEFWPDNQLAALRRAALSPWALMAMLLLFGAFILSMIFEHSGHYAYRGIGWACFLMGQNICRLAIALKAPQSTSSGPRPPTWTNAAPMRSDHWGKLPTQN